MIRLTSSHSKTSNPLGKTNWHDGYVLMYPLQLSFMVHGQQVERSSASVGMMVSLFVAQKHIVVHSLRTEQFLTGIHW